MELIFFLQQSYVFVEQEVECVHRDKSTGMVVNGYA